jgi:hypothetical protein
MNVNCTTEFGKVDDVIDGSFQKGEEETLKIGFNHKILIDALRAIGEDEVRLSFNGPTNPILFTPVHKDDEDDENDAPITAVVEGEVVLSANASVMINNSIGVKKIKCTVGLSMSGKITFDAKVELGSEDEYKEKDFLSIYVPVVVIPGLSVNVDVGFTWQYLFEASLHAEAEIKIDRTAGFEIDGASKDVIWTDNNENAKSGDKLFESDASGEIKLKGAYFIALHLKVGIGLAGEGVEFQLKVGTGPKVEAQLTYKFGQRTETLSDDLEWLAEREEIYKGLNADTYFKLQWGFLIDIVFSVGTWEFQFSEWLKLLGIENVAFIDLWVLNATPGTDKIDDRHLAQDERKYTGTLKNKLNLIFSYDAALMFVDVSPGAAKD